MRQPRRLIRLFTALALLGASSAAAAPVDVPEQTLAQFLTRETPAALDAIERPAAAIDASQYAVIAPTFTGADGNVSFVRLANLQGMGGTTAAATTFAITVVGSPSGQVYGTAHMTVPASASPQYPLSDILTAAGAGALAGGDTGYALYIQDPDASAYEHVIYNNANGFFEDVTVCDTGGYLNGKASAFRTLVNVHTSALAGYPSQVFIHNFAATATTYQVTVSDAKTGTQIGTVNLQTAANASYSMPESFFEQTLNWTPTASQPHINLVFKDTGNATVANAFAGQFILNQKLSAYINMSVACMVGSSSVASQPSASAATTFQGTIAGTASQGGTVTIIVQATVPSASAVVSASAVERPQALAGVSGTLLLSNDSSIALTGSWDSSTGALTASGGGFSFTGTVAGGVYNGSYTGPNSSVGAISALNATQNTVTAYCGAWSSSDKTDNAGSFNFQIADNGALSGTTTGGSGVTLAGHGSATSFSGTTSQGISFGGTIQGTQMSGAFAGTTQEGPVSGSMSGVQCAFPPPTGGGTGGSTGGGSSGGGGTSGGGSTGGGSTGGSTGGGSTGGGSSGGGTGAGTIPEHLLNVSVTTPDFGTGSLTSTPIMVTCKGFPCTDQKSITEGTTVVITENPLPGSTFAGWTGACSGTAATCTVVMTADQTVGAKFSGVGANGVNFVLSFKGTMSGALGAIGSAVVAASSPLGCVDNYCTMAPDGMSSGSASLPAGTKVTLVASVFGGATFAGWGGACSGLQPTCLITMDSAKSVTAQFKPFIDLHANVGGGTGQFMLNLSVSQTGKGSGTVSASPAGLSCGAGACGTTNSGGGGAYTAGTVVTLTASPASGSTFVGWGGACSGTSTCTVTMNSVQSVTATFSAP